MTKDEKKKAVVVASEPATDLVDEAAAESMKKMLLSTLLMDAMNELRAALQEKRPLVISYRVPCPCGKCNTKLAIQISPYTDVVFDALRSKH